MNLDAIPVLMNHSVKYKGIDSWIHKYLSLTLNEFTRNKKFFKPNNYINVLNRFTRKVKVIKILGIKNNVTKIFPVWVISPEPLNLIPSKSNIISYYVFDKKVDLENISWHKDLSSNFQYPLKRIDKLLIRKFYNMGIDVLPVWVLSRFHFAALFAQLYLNTKDENYYLHFKKTVINWIKNNPFLFGVNWVSPMEAAIRSINWIVAANLFGKIFKEDEDFSYTLSNSLQQHAEFISAFPEIYENGHTTNHTTADYAGLLFISLSLKNHPKSGDWLEQAISGLVACMDYQVYSDGSDFEASIPYHRLVLELFAYSAIVCRANSITLPESFYSKLFKMFEFTAAYIDQNGNAPTVGDDDSGRILVLEKPDEINFYNRNNNHQYLLEIGEHLFDYNFLTGLSASKTLNKYLPLVQKLCFDDLKIQPRTTKVSISFPNGGAYFLKNNRLDFALACFPIGQNGHGGHNHLDTGSFTLSINGEQTIVDPGTAVYSANKNKRDLFRSYTYHNTLFNVTDENISLEEYGFWNLREIYKSIINEFNSNTIDVSIESKYDPVLRRRRFIIDNEQLIIEDSYNGNFYSRLNFHPDVTILSINKIGLITNKCEIQVEGTELFLIEEYEYSICYQNTAASKYLKIFAKDKLVIRIIPKENSL